ncbi:MAG TPA: carboxypeptidase regulatory-like domain-containing protein [Acidobacteriaceae bacterium]
MALVVLFMMSAKVVLSQAQNTGTVAGNVKDSQGAVVVGATITLTSTGQNRTVSVQSNGKGEYLFNDVPVGIYTVKFSAPTFQNDETRELHVDADQNIRLDARLIPGSSEATVTVEAEGTTVDTRSATIGAMINQNFVENLPIDGENIVSLAALLPGVSGVSAPTTFTSDTGGPTYSVSGSRSNQNLFLLDGSIWNNVFTNTGLNFPPRLALQEVSVLLNNYKAQYGRNSGSVFNAITRSGSDQIHGTLWEYHQNGAFNSSDYFLGPIVGGSLHLVSNQFGATLGGPILHNKMFYFVAFQDLRLAGQVAAADETPTAPELGLTDSGAALPCVSTAFAGKQCGNFLADFPETGTLPNHMMRNPIYRGGGLGPTSIASNTLNPTCLSYLTGALGGATAAATLQYLPYPEIPVVCFNSTTVAFTNKYLPIATRALNANNSRLLSAVPKANQPRNDYNGLVRIDYNLRRHTLDARFYVTNVNDLTSNSIQSSTNSGIATYDQDFNSAGIYFGSIGDTFVLRPNMLNVLRVGYKRYAYNITPMDPTTLHDLGSSLVIPGHPTLPRMEATNRFTEGSGNSGYSDTVTQNLEVTENFTWTKGNHNYQFGAQYLNLGYLHRFDQVPYLTSEQTYTGTAVGDFLTGFLFSAVVGNATNLAATQNAFYLYAQDDWRATSKLTINYGLRYEIPMAWKESDGRGTTFIPGYQSVVFPSAPSSVAYQGDPGIGNPSPSTKYSSIAPRLGFAYDVFGTGRTSIRGGIGIFYDAINANVVGVGQPYHYSSTIAYPSGGYSNPLLGQAAIPDNYVKGNPQFTRPYTIVYADPHQTTPSTLAVNFGIQQKIGKSGTLEVNYVGKFGRHQTVPLDQNPSIYDCKGAYYKINPSLYCPSDPTTADSYAARSLYPGFNYGGQGIVDLATVGTSNYHGLQTTYSMKTRKRLVVYLSYAYAKSMDVQSNGATTTAHVPQPLKLRSEYAPSDYDAKHILNLGWTLRLPSMKHGSHIVRAVVNDWSFGGIYNARTGTPLNIAVSGDVSYRNQRIQRPSLAPGANPNLPGNRHRLEKAGAWFRNAPDDICQAGSVTPQCVWVVPSGGKFGTLSRNYMRGPAYINTNFSLSKDIKLPGKKDRLQLRAEAFNVFNTPNLAAPGVSISSSTSAAATSTFGIITGTVGTNGTAGSNGRRLQLGAVLHF